MNKRVVIMGASSGLGYEVAKCYIKAGWYVGVAARRADRLISLKELNPARVCCMEIDVNQDDVEEKLHELIDHLGGMELYFHSSGIGSQNSELDPAIEVATMQTNGMGFIRCITTAYNYFKENGGGHLAVISSIAGTRGIGSSPAYSATKRMQNTYMQALTQLSRWHHDKVVITDIRPGFVATAILKSRKYPMTLEVAYAAQKIFTALQQQKRIAIIDWRYTLVVAIWRLIPRLVWERIKV